MKLIALQRVPHPNGAIPRGETFEASETRTRQLIGLGWAALPPGDGAAPSVAPAMAATPGERVAVATPDSKAKRRRRKPLKVGELVNVEIGGALQFEAPQPVSRISQLGGETWVHVGDSKAGVLIEQIVRS